MLQVLLRLLRHQMRDTPPRPLGRPRLINVNHPTLGVLQAVLAFLAPRGAVRRMLVTAVVKAPDTDDVHHTRHGVLRAECSPPVALLAV